jgi:hypothetical protein
VTSAAILTYFFAAVWLVNGLFCKVLNLVPRHRAIVARILGEKHATFLTRAIGAAEIVMTVWIVSGIYSRLNAITQIVVVASMNVLEFYLAPDLLLWGRVNAIIATLFILLIVYKEFVLM